MCTVTFLPVGDKVFFVSSRDEKHARADAIEPDFYYSPAGMVLFPKDAHAGGTWIALHENGNVLVFLNGAFEAHTPLTTYRKSRGLILTELIASSDPLLLFGGMDLDGIEPFTGVLWQEGKLYECVWDGAERLVVDRSVTEPRLWSSSTLYDEHVRAKRRGWFDDWLVNKLEHRLPALMDFHQFTGDGDAHNDLRMNRNGDLYTVSITGIELDDKLGRMTYLDLKNNRLIIEELPISNPERIYNR
jgi:hypothetical protein